MTEEMTIRPLPEAHRMHGIAYGVLSGSLPLHVVEHASQVRQFLTSEDIEVRPMPGDQKYA